ncbi:hypothetical protein CEXT_41131 [Caerostris extrusa]|uniref:Uncharacterized protein n=1 Tax=Caerostris extrusa TaxID=172846 RepID=A0AAV4QD41_CAEEX|nr:hypothetical protein CEXT_41131 [Caerostris extrusa]
MRILENSERVSSWCLELSSRFPVRSMSLNVQCPPPLPVIGTRRIVEEFSKKSHETFPRWPPPHPIHEGSRLPQGPVPRSCSTSRKAREIRQRRRENKQELPEQFVGARGY